MPSRDQKLTGSAGEHFVCSMLAQLDWAASLTREGVARADILAVRADIGSEQPERPMIEVQVKTMRHSPQADVADGARGITPTASAREWYVFVLLGKDVRDRPRCWVVPRDHAVAGAWIAQMHWLTEPGIPAGQRNAPITQARIGIDVWGRYEERWDLLDHSAYDAPVLLPDWIMDRIDEPRIAFPEAHRWRRHGVPPRGGVIPGA
jgi:hypothetical protein